MLTTGVDPEGIAPTPKSCFVILAPSCLSCLPHGVLTHNVPNLFAFSEIDQEGVIEPDTDEPEEMGGIEDIEVQMFTIALYFSSELNKLLPDEMYIFLLMKHTFHQTQTLFCQVETSLFKETPGWEVNKLSRQTFEHVSIHIAR